MTYEEKVTRLLKNRATVTDATTGEVYNTNYVLTEDEAWEAVMHGEMSFKYGTMTPGILTVKIADVVLTFEGNHLYNVAR